MIRVRQVEVKLEKNNIEEIKKQTAYKLKININDIKNIKINKQSIDARKKPSIKFIYEVDVDIFNEDKIKIKNNDILKTPNQEYKFEVTGKLKQKNRPIIVGSGPAGLFCAYFLAQNGYNPIIIERGEKVEDRIKTVEEFWENGKLNINSNVQFGEGGAGTFSDGKLNTLTKDPLNRMKKVFEIFVENGANEDILYSNKPHIGTDVLRKVVKNMRNKIISMGAEFKYNTTLTDLILENNKLNAIEINHNEIINCDTLVLSIGHSARDTFEMLYNKNINMTSKPFAIGVRVQHPQKMINMSQYGYESHPNLPKASYKLTYQASNKRGVYSFCMCPGGYVVNASSEENRLVVNGMSNYKRESENANSAIVVTVSPEDYGNNPLDGIKYQRKLEEKACLNNKIPVQLYKDFKNNVKSNGFGIVNPIFKGKYEFSNLNDILPDYIVESLKEGIDYFGTKIKGFDMDDTLLAGIETRTSSPIRIERNEIFESNIKGIYPCGEGSGYAGGITTSAMDGMKIAEAIAKIYNNL